MRDLGDIKIVKGVSHVIAPRDPAQLLRLSEAEFPLGGGVGDILAAHVIGGLQDAQAKAAKFADRRPARVSNLFAKLLEHPPDSLTSVRR